MAQSFKTPKHTRFKTYFQISTFKFFLCLCCYWKQGLSDVVWGVAKSEGMQGLSWGWGGGGVGTPAASTSYFDMMNIAICVFSRLCDLAHSNFFLMTSLVYFNFLLSQSVPFSPLIFCSNQRTSGFNSWFFYLFSLCPFEISCISTLSSGIAI